MKLRKKSGILIAAVIMVMFLTSTGMCQKSGYRYISVQDMKVRMDAGDHENGSLAIMTSQTEKEYKTGYIKAAYPTYARPLKTDADYAKLIPFLNKVKNTNEDIIFICPRGKSGAERPYDYFKKNGFDEKRLMILKGGQEAFNKAYPKDVTFPK